MAEQNIPKIPSPKCPTLRDTLVRCSQAQSFTLVCTKILLLRQDADPHMEAANGTRLWTDTYNTSSIRLDMKLGAERSVPKISATRASFN